MKVTNKYFASIVLGIFFIIPAYGLLDAAEPKKQKILYTGMILGRGGLGDRSFNDSAYIGLQEAQRKYGIRFETISHTTDQANLEALHRLIRQGFDLIIGIGYENAGYIKSLSGRFPDRKFACVDIAIKGPNIASVVYREQEGDFLMGGLAAILTKTKKVGFVGGMDIGVIQRIESGFKQGVAFQDRNVAVMSDIAGTFADPKIGKALALAQYGAGVDLIYNAAGRTGLGIIEAAKEAGKLTIGTSGDQRYLAPGNVVGNRPKRVDKAVLMLLEDLKDGHFRPGIRSLGLKEGGLSLGPFDETLVSKAIFHKLEALKKKIINKEIRIKLPGE